MATHRIGPTTSIPAATGASALAAGTDRREARRLYGGNKDLLRVGRLEFKLTVA